MPVKMSQSYCVTSWTPLVHVRDLNTYNLRPPKKIQKQKKVFIRQETLIGVCSPYEENTAAV